MAAEGLSLDWYVFRHRNEREVLPWDHISAGLHHDFLWQDWQDALAEHGLEDCRWTPCYDCGVCTGYGLEHVVASPTPPAGGSQGTGAVSGRRAPGAAAHWRATEMRIRIRYSKLGKIRWTSHRDVARMWERAFRGSISPWRCTEGFSPRPKLSFGLALSTGHESLGEYLDVELRQEAAPPSTSRTCRRCSTPALPHGVDVQAIRVLAGPVTSLQQDVTCCSWSLTSSVRPTTSSPASSTVSSVPPSSSPPAPVRVTNRRTTSARPSARCGSSAPAR